MRGIALLVAVAAAMAVGACGSGDSEPASTDGPQAEAQEPDLPAERDFLDDGAKILPVSGDWMTAGGGSVWTNERANVAVLDANTGKETDFIRVPQAPCQDSDFGYGAYWTATCTEDGLARIDANTHEVRHVDLDTPTLYDGGAEIAVGEGAVWMIVDGSGCEACELVGVDPKSMEVVHEVQLAEGASGVEVGFGYVWVVNPKADTVTRIDPATDEILGETTVEGSARYLAAGEDSMWVFEELEGNVIELDPDGQEVRVVAADMAGAGGTLTVADGSVWVRGALKLLEEIDEETGDVVARFGPESGFGDVLVAYGFIWVSRPSDNELKDILRLPVADAR